MTKPPKKILICDDEEGIRESLRLILDDHYNLAMTNSAEEALVMLKNDPAIGLALLDIKMPRVNGLELLPQIKQQYPKVKVIMVTGYQSGQTTQEAARLGADSYLIKPFKSDDILAKVRENLK